MDRIGHPVGMSGGRATLSNRKGSLEYCEEDNGYRVLQRGKTEPVKMHDGSS